MTIHHSMDTATRLVTYRLEGPPHPEEFKEFLDSVLQDPRFERGFAFLGDWRGITGDPEPTLLRAVASQLRMMADAVAPCKWGMLFLSGRGCAAARICALLTQGSEIEFASFSGREEAEKWLGVECPGIAETIASPGPTEHEINYLLDIRRRPGSGLHPRVRRRLP